MKPHSTVWNARSAAETAEQHVEEDAHEFWIPVEAVRRALALLEELNRQRINSVQHLHEVTALPKSTIVRLLETLRLLGYVANDPRQGGYQVTSGVRGLSSGFHGDPLVVEAARSWAIEFTRRHKLPIGIALFDRDAMVVRFSTTRESPMSPFHATVNMRLPLLTRAMGRAYIAFCPAAERKYILRVLARSAHPEDRAARQPEEVREIIARVRRNGFAERSPDVPPRSANTFSVPIRLGGKVLATLGVSYYYRNAENEGDSILRPSAFGSGQEDRSERN